LLLYFQELNILKGVDIMYRKTANGIGILFFVTFLFLTVSGCMVSTGMSVSSGPPPWGHGNHHYRYYPYDNIYFDEQQGVYFYLYNGGWQMSVSLPSYVQITVNDFVTLDMDTDKPYQYHNDVVKRYPPGQKKKDQYIDRNKSQNTDRSKSQDKEQNNPKDMDRFKSQEKDQSKSQDIDRNKSEDKNQNKYQSIDRSKSQEKDQPKAQDKDKTKVNTRDKNKSKDKDEVTDKDKDKNQDKEEDNN
jgi:hypothetical protein